MCYLTLLEWIGMSDLEIARKTKWKFAMKCSHCPHNIKKHDIKLSWKDWEQLWNVQKLELTHGQSMQELSFIVANMQICGVFFTVMWLLKLIVSNVYTILWCNYFRWSPDIFQASSFQLLKLENLLRWSFFTYIYNHSTIWISYIFHIISLHRKIWTQQIDLAPNMWLHNSVGWALHWYRRGHGFQSRWSPDIFQASSFELLKLENLQYCDDHSSLTSTTAVQYEFHIIIFHKLFQHWWSSQLCYSTWAMGKTFLRHFLSLLLK